MTALRYACPDCGFRVMTRRRCGGCQAKHDAETRDKMLAAAIRKHDMAFGSDHCDRKYILSCQELPNLILQLAVREVPDA